MLQQVLGVIQRGLDAGDLKAFLVTGTPGIGKSFFGYFLLYCLRKQGETVVYQAGADSWFRFSNEGVKQAAAEGGFKEFFGAGYFRDRAMWFLCDPPEKKHAWDKFPGKTVALMSPNRERYQGLVKQGKLMKLVMPPWTLEELQECRGEVFPATSDEDVRRTFEVVGGVARRVFDREMRMSAESDMISATQAAEET